jgi:hypothetical protein
LRNTAAPSRKTSAAPRFLPLRATVAIRHG